MRKIALLALALSLFALTSASATEPDKIIVPRYKFSYQGGYYYQSSPYRMTQDELDEFSNKVADKVVEKLLKKLAEDEKNQAPSKPGDPPGTVVPKAAQAPTPKALSADLQYLVKSCVTCHGPQGTIRGGFRLFTADGTIDPKVDWWTVWDRMTTDDAKMRMPPGKPKAPAEVTDAIVNRARTKK